MNIIQFVRFTRNFTGEFRTIGFYNHKLSSFFNNRQSIISNRDSIFIFSSTWQVDLRSAISIRYSFFSSTINNRQSAIEIRYSFFPQLGKLIYDQQSAFVILFFLQQSTIDNQQSRFDIHFFLNLAS